MEEYIDDFIDKIRNDDRILELSTFAEQYGLDFVKRDRFGPQDHRLKGFKIFKGKRGKRMRGIISNPEPSLPCTSRIYDYHYYGDGATKKTTIVEVKSNDIVVPDFVVKGKGSMKRFKEMFSKDKSIIEDREFNEHYFVDCIDQEWVSNTFNSSLTDLILSRKNVTIEGSRNYLLIYYKKKRIQIDKLIKEYEFALDIFNVMIGGGGSGEFV